MDNDKGYTEEDKKRHVVTHPLVRTNPVNGRKALYVGSHAQEIVGMAPEEGARLLDELTAFVTQHGIRPIVGKTFDFDSMADAHAFIESRKSVGKVVVTVD